MGGFLVVEERSYLPRWIAKHIGAYLPPCRREVSLCGADGSHLLYHDLSSPRVRKKVTEHLHEAQKAGMVCGLIGREEVRQAIGSALDAPLFDGRLLCASLRLKMLADEAGDSTRITLLDADSELGQAAAVYLAKRVRYLSIDGRRTGILKRLARRLWQTDGIAVRVGRGEGDTLVSMEDVSRPCECVTNGVISVSPVLAECALFAGEDTLRASSGTAAGSLARTAETALLRGMALLPKKSTRSGKFD